MKFICPFKSFFASGEYCHLLVTFVSSLNQDQDRHVGPDLDPSCFDTPNHSNIIPERIF